MNLYDLCEALSLYITRYINENNENLISLFSPENIWPADWKECHHNEHRKGAWGFRQVCLQQWHLHLHKDYQGKLQFRKEEAVRKQQSYFPDRHGYGLLAKQIHLPCTEYRFSEYRRVWILSGWSAFW